MARRLGQYAAAPIARLAHRPPHLLIEPPRACAVKFCKVKCAIHKANGMPHEISHLQKLKWKDQVEIVEMMGKTVEKGAATEALKARSDKLYALIEVLQGMTKANIKELCEANGSQVHGDKAAPPDMAYTAADGLLYGKLGECPW